MKPQFDLNELRDLRRRRNFEWKDRHMEHLGDRVHEFVAPLIGEIPPYDIKAIIELFGIRVIEESSLGVFVGEDGVVETAGIADGDNNVVRIAMKFLADVRRFTMGHEFAHFILHEAFGQHRDRPIDGTQRRRRERRERDADYLGGCIAMPRSRMRHEFVIRFLTDVFEARNENLMFALCGSTDVRGRWTTEMDLARELAKAPYFNSRPIEPLHERFGASVQATAIRIRQLGLVRLF